jgi:RHS repeat-associated protein
MRLRARALSSVVLSAVVGALLTAVPFAAQAATPTLPHATRPVPPAGRPRPAPPGRTHQPTGALSEKGRVAPPGAAELAAARPRPGHVAPMPLHGGGTGWGPQDLWSAYALPATQLGAGKLVAIVDAWDNPNVESDLATYRADWGLAPCTTANGCFRKIAQNGSTIYPAPAPASGGWAPEIALDVEMVSATCPLCRILLVEASSDSTADLLAAVDQAVAQGAQAVNMSWGALEWSGETANDAHFQHPGVAFVASSGDYGYGSGTIWPAASPTVFAVGGTNLFKDVNGAWYEQAWAGSTSGCSPYEAKPSWQHDTGCARRTVADISADAGTSLALYSTFPANGWTSGWQGAGGTSASAPMIAGLLMLPNNAQDMSGGPSVWYQSAYAPGAFSVYDVTAGSTGTCGGSYLCTSMAYYDGPTGLGTPQGPPPFGAQRAPSWSYGGYNKGVTGPPPCSEGDPVVCRSGDFYETVTDAAVPGRGRMLDFARTYNGLDAATNGPLGYGWTHAYAMSLTTNATTGAVTVHQENGSTVTFESRGAGYVAPGWVTATLAHNANGTYTYTLPDLTTDTFDATGRLVSESDRNGYVTSLTYDGSGRLTTVTEPAGRTLAFGYDAAGRLASVTDPAGRTTTYGYDAAGNLATATDPAGHVRSYGYDALHRMTTMTDAENHTTTNVYDSASRVTSQTDRRGRTTTFAYTATTTTVTHPSGRVDRQTYNDYDELVSVVHGYGTAVAQTTTFGYNPFSGQRVTVTDGNGRTWRTEYDAHGDETSSTDPLGHTTTATYDDYANVTSVTDALSATTTVTYDAQRNPLTITGPGGVTTSVTYDPAHPGDVLTRTDAAGGVWRYTYDAYGDRTSVTDPVGNVARTTFDVIGRPLTSVSPRGSTTTLGYDAAGNVTSVTDPLGRVSSATYDALGHRRTVVDGAGHPTTLDWDGAGNLVATHEADGTVESTGYDDDGHVTTQTDGLGHVTSYAFDAAGRVTSVTDPLGRATSFGYDAGGNRTRVTDAAGRVTTLGYDAANRLVSVTYSDGTTPNESYTYDAANQRRTMTDGTGTTSYTYDALHRITDVADAGGHVGYGYDATGRVTRLTYPSGSVVTRTYDAAGRLTAVADWLGHTFTFGYDADGHLVRDTRPNGTAATSVYDAAGQLTRILDTGPQGSTVMDLPYTYDAAGLLASGNPLAGPAAVTQTYGYDATARLTSADVPAGTTSVPANGYAYDAADNLTRMVTAGVARTLVHDAADQLTAVTSAAGTVTYANDARGNRTGWNDAAGNTATYSYDQANRLAASTGPAVTAVNAKSPAQAKVGYGYNADGLRTQKRVYVNATWVAVREVWDVVGAPPAMLTDGVYAFVYGPAGIPLEQVAGTALYLHTDRLGSVRAVTTQQGNVVATADYDPYGRVARHGGVVSPLGFAGQYTDVETGLVYMRARYYDPTTGQFLTRDPLSPASRSPYGYVGDSPLNGVDPYGLICLSLHCILKDIGIGAAVVGLAAAAVILLPEVTVGAVTVFAIEEGTALALTEAGELIAIDYAVGTVAEIEVTLGGLVEALEIGEAATVVGLSAAGLDTLNTCMSRGFSAGECKEAMLHFGVDAVSASIGKLVHSPVYDFLDNLRVLHNLLAEKEGKPC